MKRIYDIMKFLNENYNQDKPSFTITVGIPGSGKSTWINSQVLDQNTEVVSPDDIRRELTGNVSDQTQNKRVFEIAYQRTIDYLNQGINVIFDATNVYSFGRKKMLETLRNSVDTDFIAYAKVFEVKPEEAKKRIKDDIEELGKDRSNVPPEIIDKQYINFLKDKDKIESDGYKIIT